MMATASKFVITLLICAVGFGLAKPARAQTTPPPPSPEPGGPAADGGSEVKADFVGMLTLVLGLSTDQQTQVRTIFDATRAQAKTIGEDKTLSQDDKKAKIGELRETANTRIRALLTPDQQKRFDDLQQQLPHGPGMRNPSGAAAEPGGSGPGGSGPGPGGSGPGAEPGGPGPGGDPVAMFAAALKLTASQQTEIKSILEVMHPQMKAVEDDTTLSQDQKKAKIKDLRDATHAKIRAVLTPEQQQKFDEILKEILARTSG